MNFIAFIILTALIVNFVLEIIADVLNLKSTAASPPKGFEDVYDPERYRKSQEYLKVNTRFGWITAIVDMVVILVFWFGKGFPLLDQWVRSFGWGAVGTGLIYMGILMLLKSVIDIPFSVYQTFVIEERFGFNKTTWQTFIMDRVKGTLLGIVIGTPLMAAVLAFFEYAGADAWWACWLAVTVYILMVQFVAPAWILPIFNKYEPLEEGDLRKAIMDYARSVNYPISNLYVMDGSKRSGKSNAFFTGFGKNRRIALFDTLIEQHTIPELVAVLAHEIGHYKKKHVLLGMVIGIIHMGVMFFLLSFFISYQGLFDAFYMPQPSVYAGLIFFGMLFSPIDFFLGILLQKLSRKNEYEADWFSVETTKDPEAMVSGLKKLSADNLSDLMPHPFYVMLHGSHPPVTERIAAILGRE